MQHDCEATRRLGVFATTNGWLLADAEHKEWFGTWSDAVDTALRRAHLERWRGAEVEVVAQVQAGGSLIVIEPAAQMAGPRAL
ncbi:MAG: hypothetical protein ACREEW_03570 [Caulobacteraceae bacterium]